MSAGFTAFKVKVGKNLNDDIKRLEFIRSIIGWENTLVSRYFSTYILNEKYTINYRKS